MYLVNDVHALAHRRGREERLLPQGAHIVHAVVGGRVQLYHVHDGAVQDAAAGRALPTGIAVHRVLTVDRAGQDAGAGGLARAAGADEEIGMGQAVVPDLVFQRLRHVLLTDDRVKGLGPPLAV